MLLKQSFITTLLVPGLALFAGQAASAHAAHAEYQAASQARTSAATLYWNPGCSHCKKVLGYLSSINKSLPMKNTAVPQFRGELSRLGVAGVPALVVDSKVIVGS